MMEAVDDSASPFEQCSKTPAFAAASSNLRPESLWWIGIQGVQGSQAGTCVSLSKLAEECGSSCVSQKTALICGYSNTRREMMPWCPVCLTEYEAGVERCSDCDAALTDVVPPVAADLHTPSVIVFTATSYGAAEVVYAMLQGAGLDPMIYSPDTGPARMLFPSPGHTLLPVPGDTWTHAVLVSPAHAEAARALLTSPEPTEEELTAEEEADPVKLEEAEAQVKDV
jgi:hypothetical protein